MKRYQRPEVFEALAAEYVLGTLQGKARQRFETLMREHQFLQAVVADWEKRLSPALEFSAETIKPPKQVWQGISQQIRKQQHEQERQAKQRTPAKTGAETSWWSSVLFWKGVSLASLFSMAMMMLMSFFIWQGMQSQMTAEPERFVANLKMMDNGPHKVAAVFEADPDQKRFYVNVMHKSDMPEDMSYQLWCVDYGSSRPIPMGSIADSGMTEMPFKNKTWKHLQKIQMLMVTMEPKGQAPVEPSGKVVFEGRMIPVMQPQPMTNLLMPRSHSF